MGQLIQLVSSNKVLTFSMLQCYSSPLSVTNIAEMAMFYIKLTSLNDFPLEEGPISPTGQFKQSLDIFYVTVVL